MTMTYAELCAGYGGLGLAIEHVFGAHLAWYSEFDKAPSAVMAAHWPGVPNLGDMTKINWAACEPVDVFSAGTPCQDLSGAGRRAGMTEGTRSNLWVQMREAINTMQPEWVIWENVKGAYSAKATSEVEPCEGCVGDPEHGEPVLRALGRVLGDLSELGYDTQWRGLRASQLGACHHRHRVFVLAHRRSARHPRHDAGSAAKGVKQKSATRRTLEPGSSVVALPTPNASVSNDGEEPETWFARKAAANASTGIPLAIAVQTLPTPSANLGTKGGVQHPDKRKSGGHQAGLDDVVAYLPTPKAADREFATPSTSGRDSDHATHLATRVVKGTNWGRYAAAISSHERLVGRSAPAPTRPNPRTGKPQLSPWFTEWMMGLPEGWICDVPLPWLSDAGKRSAQLKLAGNGVFPIQAVAAIQDMLNAFCEQETPA